MNIFFKKYHTLLSTVFFQLNTRNLTVSVAESCTGGFVSSCFTSISGSSHFFKGSMVVYSIQSKIKFLDLREDDINHYGVVSEPVVIKMAQSVRKKYNTDFGLATTGYVDINKDSAKLEAWICVDSLKNTHTQCVVLEQSRLENIELVSSSLFKLLRKEIV